MGDHVSPPQTHLDLLTTQQLPRLQRVKGIASEISAFSIN
jgi:hypothetical protein